MSNQMTAPEISTLIPVQGEACSQNLVSDPNNQVLSDNPVIQRALRRLKDSQEK